MQTFQVAFVYQGIYRIADIAKHAKVDGMPVQFHATNIEPSIPGAADVYMFSDSPKGFCWGDSPGCADLGGAIMIGITSFCMENKIGMHT